MRSIAFIPLLIFALLGVLLAAHLLRNNANTHDNPLLGKPLPAFTAAPLEGTAPLDNAALPPGLKAVHFFASWCTPCQVEHPQLMTLATADKLPIYGIAWHDAPDNTKAWLASHGSPYRLAASDQAGKAGLTLGITGVPELFLIDADNNIIYHHAGPLTDADLTDIRALSSSHAR